MKKKVKNLVQIGFVSMILATPCFANAATEKKGFYGTFYTQMSTLPSTTFDETNGGGLGNGLKASYDMGLGLGADFGYYYGSGWAAEVEWNVRSHETEKLEKNGNKIAEEGDFFSSVVLVNAIRRFPNQTKFTPYVGAGLGWVQEIDFDIEDAAGERSYSKNNALAAQLMGGGEYRFAEHWSVTSDARFLYLGDLKLKLKGGTQGTLEKPSYNPFSLQIGLRYNF